MTACLVCGSPIPVARLHHPIPAVTCSRQCAIERKRANDRAGSARRYKDRRIRRELRGDES